MSEPITSGRFDQAHVDAMVLPRRAGSGFRAGALYILEFSSGMVKVGRTNRPLSRIREHTRHAMRYSGAPLVQGWLSEVHGDVAAAEATLVLEGGRLAERVEGREHLFGVSFDVLVLFAESIPPAPESESDIAAAKEPDALINAIKQGIRQVLRAEDKAQWLELPAGDDPTEADEMIELLGRIADASRLPRQEVMHWSFMDLKEHLASVTAKADIAELQASIWEAGRLDLFLPMLPEERRPYVPELGEIAPVLDVCDSAAGLLSGIDPSGRETAMDIAMLLTATELDRLADDGMYLSKKERGELSERAVALRFEVEIKLAERRAAASLSSTGEAP